MGIYLMIKLRGASTITQQLIKNSSTLKRQNIIQKVEEALMAILLELSYDERIYS